MRVTIVIVMQTTLMGQLHVLFKPSIGLGPRVPPMANAHLKGLAQAKISKKSVILFRVLNMTI